jgi:hypothetical protein
MFKGGKLLHIFNGTPHSINIVKGSEFNDAIRKYTGGNVVLRIESNGLLNAKIATVEVPGESIPTFSKEIQGCDEYPDDYDIVIVSALYATAYRNMFGEIPYSMRIVADPVMTDDGKTFVGCRGLAYPF